MRSKVVNKRSVLTGEEAKIEDRRRLKSGSVLVWKLRPGLSGMVGPTGMEKEPSLRHRPGRHSDSQAPPPQQGAEPSVGSSQ